MSLPTALAALEAVVDDNTADVATRIRAANALAAQVRGADAGSPQANTAAKLTATALWVIENTADPALRVAGAELLILLEEA